MSSGGVAPEGLAVTVEHGLREVVVAVRGTVDFATASHLGAALDAVLRDPPERLVVDLAGLDFIDAAGVTTIVTAANSVGRAGGTLTVRAAPRTARRVFAIVGLSDLLAQDEAGTEDLVGAGQCVPGARSTAPSRSAHAGSELRELGTALGSDLVVNAALGLVVALAAATIGGADGVSISLSRDGALCTVAASDDTVAQMDRDQYTTGQGPCVAASTEGRWFHIESLANERRWPAFVPRAMAGGIGSILSTPLRVATRPVGALNIYSKAADAFGPADWELAALFATQASGILTEARADTISEQEARRLGQALRSRELIAQAQGVVMERDGASPDAAFGALRRLAARRGATLSGVAAQVVASTQQPDLIFPRAEA